MQVTTLNIMTGQHFGVGGMKVGCLIPKLKCFSFIHLYSFSIYSQFIFTTVPIQNHDKQFCLRIPRTKKYMHCDSAKTAQNILDGHLPAIVPPVPVPNVTASTFPSMQVLCAV